METKTIKGTTIFQLPKKENIDGEEYIPCEYNKNNYCFDVELLKENSDRCCYYNGKWNIKDLILYSVCIIIGALLVHYLS